MEVTLERWADSPHGMFGTLRVGDLELVTVERPWKDNKRRVSAIPAGTYRITLGRYNRGGYPAYELHDVPGRDKIKIHIANTMDQLLGCIGVGDSLGMFSPKEGLPTRWAVANSAQSLRAFMAKMAGVKESTITIFNTDSLSS